MYNLQCYIIIELTFLKELILIKQVHQEGAIIRIIVTPDIFQIKILSSNQMSAIAVMMY